MSSVSGSDNSSRKDDAVRRAREEYQSKESELMKKHQRELRRISEMHNSELENVKQAHAAQIEELKNQSRNTVTTRDRKYQKEIDGLRDMHRKQLESLANDTQKSIEVNNRTTDSEMEQLRLRYESRIKDLSDDHNRNSQTQTENYNKSLDENREISRQSINEQREKLNKKHMDELTTLNQYQQRQKDQLQREYNTYRKDSEIRMKNQSVQHLQDKQRMSENSIDQMIRNREAGEVQKEILRDGFAEGLDTMRKRYEEKAKEERILRDDSVGAFKESVNDRIEGRIRSLERENQDLKASNVTSELQMKREKERQVQAVRDSYGRNIENLEEQRQMLLDSNNKRRARDLAEQQKEYEKRFAQTNRFYGEKIELQERRSAQAMEATVNDLKAHGEHLRNTTDARVKHIVEETEAEKVRMREHQMNTHQTMRDLQSDELREIRLNADQQRFDAIERMKDQIRKREIQHSDQMSTVVSKYEKEIKRLNDEMVKSKRQGDLDNKRLVDEVMRAHQKELSSQNIQTQERLKNMEEQHNREIKVINERNQAQLDQVISTLKKT